MRPIARFTRFAIIAVSAAALTAGGAGAVGKPIIDNEGYVWLPGTLMGGSATGQGERVVIRAMKWGNTEDGVAIGGWAKADGLDVTWDVGGSAAGRVNKVEGFTVKQNVAESSAKERQAGQSELQAEKHKDQAAGWHNPGNTKYSNVKLSRGSAGSTNDPDRPFVLARPAGKGSVWVRVATPWNGCRVGASYPSIDLSDGGQRYRLEGVSVANCGRSGDADDRPTEEVAFYYNRIALNQAR